jgi:hypothetical protein
MSLNRVTISALFYGQTVQNVFYLLNADGGTPMSAIAQKVYDEFIGSSGTVGIKHLCSSEVVWISVKVEDVTTPAPSPAILAINRAGDLPPTDYINPAGCFILQLRTGIAGRSGHGRIYLPGVTPDFMVHGLRGPNADPYIAQCMPGLKNAWLGVHAPDLYLVVHKKNGSFADHHEVTDLQISTHIGIQRRRMPGVGI